MTKGKLSMERDAKCQWDCHYNHMSPAQHLNGACFHYISRTQHYGHIYIYVYNAYIGDIGVYVPARAPPAMAELWARRLRTRCSTNTEATQPDPLGVARKGDTGDFSHCVFLNWCKSLFPNQQNFKELRPKL